MRALASIVAIRSGDAAAESGRLAPLAAAPVCAQPTAGRCAGSAAPQRIISLVPAVTEMLFAIGAGPQVVAVSSYDNYPPEVAEAASGSARCSILTSSASSRCGRISSSSTGARPISARSSNARSIPIFVYSHAGLAGHHRRRSASRRRASGTARGAQLLADRIDRDEWRRSAVASPARPRPRTLLVFGREAFALRGIYASGGIGFLHDMLDAAGGDNVFADVKREAVQATTELILARRPTSSSSCGSSVPTEAERAASWRLEYARRRCPPSARSACSCSPTSSMSIAGPRVGEVVEILGRTIHPEGVIAVRD